jgi:hypothetical protein
LFFFSKKKKPGHGGMIPVFGDFVERLAFAAVPLHVEPLDLLATPLQRAGRVPQGRITPDHQQRGFDSPQTGFAFLLAVMQVGQSALSLFRLWRRVAVPNLQQ